MYTEYQAMMFRFLQAKRDFPHLNHDGHGPKATLGALQNGFPDYGDNTDKVMMIFSPRAQEIEVEREFRRSM